MDKIKKTQMRSTHQKNIELKAANEIYELALNYFFRGAPIQPLIYLNGLGGKCMRNLKNIGVRETYACSTNGIK